MKKRSKMAKSINFPHKNTTKPSSSDTFSKNTYIYQNCQLNTWWMKILSRKGHKEKRGPICYWLEFLLLLLFVRLVGWFVCHNFLKEQEVSLPCFYRCTFFDNVLIFRCVRIQPLMTASVLMAAEFSRMVSRVSSSRGLTSVTSGTGRDARYWLNWSIMPE